MLAKDETGLMSKTSRSIIIKTIIELSKKVDKNAVWSLFKTTEIDKIKTFNDKEINGQKTMIYIARLLDEKGNTSNYSKPLELRF